MRIGNENAMNTCCLTLGLYPFIFLLQGLRKLPQHLALKTISPA